MSTPLMRRKPSPPEATSFVHRHKLPLIIGGLTVTLALLLGLVWGLYFAFHNSTSSPGSDATAGSSLQATTRTVSGKSADEDKQAAVAALNKLLKASLESPTTGMTFEERLKKLDQGDYSVVNKTITDNVYFSNDATEGLKNTSYEALLLMASTLKNKTPTGVIAPTSTTAWQQAYGEPALGTVFVPFTVFLDSSGTFSAEMIYQGGVWKLAPYSLADAIRLSASWATGTSSSASATPKK